MLNVERYAAYVLSAYDMRGVSNGYNDVSEKLAMLMTDSSHDLRQSPT